MGSAGCNGVFFGAFDAVEQSLKDQVIASVRKLADKAVAMQHSLLKNGKKASILLNDSHKTLADLEKQLAEKQIDQLEFNAQCATLMREQKKKRTQMTTHGMDIDEENDENSDKEEDEQFDAIMSDDEEEQ